MAWSGNMLLESLPYWTINTSSATGIGYNLQLEFVRVVATARLLMPRSYVRLSAGRADMSDAVQALCFLAGANSIFYGDRLLTTPNPGRSHDEQLFARLGIEPEKSAAVAG